MDESKIDSKDEVLVDNIKSEVENDLVNSEQVLVNENKIRKIKTRTKKSLRKARKIVKDKDATNKDILKSLLELKTQEEEIKATKDSTKKVRKPKGEEVNLGKAKSESKTKPEKKVIPENLTEKVGKSAGILALLLPLLVGVVDKIKSYFDTIKNWVQDNVRTPINNIIREVKEFFYHIQAGIDYTIDSVSYYWDYLSATINNFFVGIYNRIMNSQLVDWLKENFELGWDTTPREETPLPQNRPDYNTILEGYLEQLDRESDAQDLSGSSNEVTAATSTNNPYNNPANRVEIRPSEDVTQSDEARNRVRGMIAHAMDQVDNDYIKGVGYEGNNTKSETDSAGYCARYVIDAINSQLPDDQKIPMSNAYELFEDPRKLLDAGFVPVDMTNDTLREGDLIVENRGDLGIMNPNTGRLANQWGHVQLYAGDTGTGRNFISDFMQRSTNVHSVNAGDKMVWRYVGRGSGAGNGGADHSSNESGSIAANTTNNVYNQYNTNNTTESEVYIDISSSIQAQV